jgi:hypothetical protein
VGGINAIMIEPSNVDFQEVLEKVQKLVPEYILSLIDTVYVGYFAELELKQMNSAYIDGAIYMLPAQSSVDDAAEDIVHELAHAFEEQYRNEIYGDYQISQEFIIKRRKLKDILSSQGFDCSDHDFDNVNYDFDLDSFYFVELGYPLLHALSTGLFLNPYAATSLREYFATAFEDYFMHRDRKAIKEVCPSVYEKLEEIEGNLL